LARKHKLQVYFRPSSRGGTGVVMRVPNQLVIHPREEAPAASSRAVGATQAAGGDSSGAATTATAVLDAPSDEEVAEITELPKRPRGQTLAAAVRATETDRQVPRRTEKKTDIGARFSAFQQGSRSTPAENAGETAGEDDSE
jgi:hypothetical protein